jgi:hypothetical protein
VCSTSAARVLHPFFVQIIFIDCEPVHFHVTVIDFFGMRVFGRFDVRREFLVEDDF